MQNILHLNCLHFSKNQLRNDIEDRLYMNINEKVNLNAFVQFRVTLHDIIQSFQIIINAFLIVIRSSISTIIHFEFLKRQKVNSRKLEQKQIMRVGVKF